MRSNQLSYPAMTVVKKFVEIEGLEPSLTEPESVVLPLHHISIWLPFLIWDCKGMNVLLKCKTFCNKLHVFRSNCRNLQSVDIKNTVQMVDFVLEDDGSEAVYRVADSFD